LFRQAVFGVLLVNFPAWIIAVKQALLATGKLPKFYKMIVSPPAKTLAIRNGIPQIIAHPKYSAPVDDLSAGGLTPADTLTPTSAVNTPTSQHDLGIDLKPPRRARSVHRGGSDSPELSQTEQMCYNLSSIKPGSQTWPR
jgi:hypothetical protein